MSIKKLMRYLPLILLLLPPKVIPPEPPKLRGSIIIYEEPEWKEYEPQPREIIFSTFNDNVFSQGKITKDMLELRDGLYYYGEHVAIATAHDRLGHTEYPTYEEYDVLDLEIEGKKYTGIVIDVCGACMGVSHETEQRIDILSTESWLKKGYVYE